MSHVDDEELGKKGMDSLGQRLCSTALTDVAKALHARVLVVIYATADGAFSVIQINEVSFDRDRRTPVNRTSLNSVGLIVEVQLALLMSTVLNIC